MNVPGHYRQWTTQNSLSWDLEDRQWEYGRMHCSKLCSFLRVGDGARTNSVYDSRYMHLYVTRHSSREGCLDRCVHGSPIFQSSAPHFWQNSRHWDTVVSVSIYLLCTLQYCSVVVSSGIIRTVPVTQKVNSHTVPFIKSRNKFW